MTARIKRRGVFESALLVLLFGCMAARGAVQPPKFDADAVQALQDVALASGADAADHLAERLGNGAIAASQWQLDFKQYFVNGVFTTALAQFWTEEIGAAEGGDQLRIATLSALCAAEAISAAAPTGLSLPAAYDSLVISFNWIAYVGPRLGVNERASVFASLSKSLGANLPSYARDPQRYPLYVQAAIALQILAGTNPQSLGSLGTLLGLGPGPLSTLQAHGILVFDNGAFTAQHYASLNTLLASIPKGLHAIRAIIVPESTGIPAGTQFISPDQIIYLPYVPMETMTSPYEFITNAKPIAPVFTANAAQEIIRAVQVVQFSKRPALIARRDVILANALLREERYLRYYRMVSPAVYAGNPDELLPRIAYVYFINSEVVFDMAATLFSLRAQEPMDQYLLMADLLSGGGNTSPLYETGLNGEVRAAQATIGRTHGSWIRAPYNGNTLVGAPMIPADLWFCNAIAYGGASYVFELDEHGITTRFIRK